MGGRFVKVGTSVTEMDTGAAWGGMSSEGVEKVREELSKVSLGAERVMGEGRLSEARERHGYRVDGQRSDKVQRESSL